MKKSRPVKRSMRPSSQPHDSSQDQVGDHSLDHLETLMRWFKIKSYRIKLRFTLLNCIHGCGFDGGATVKELRTEKEIKMRKTSP
ncbi:hypothetical protein Goklo_013895, partial [Gossypium klotzschianum]|nr:hypothetical protein [Gossypium klotzschianum]